MWRATIAALILTTGCAGSGHKDKEQPAFIEHHEAAKVHGHHGSDDDVGSSILGGIIDVLFGNDSCN